jgi:Domain of unknown function (DUF6438)
MRLSLVLLAGCWTSSSPTEPVAEAPPSAFEITLERTTCFGACPAYRLSIDGDGRVRWFGVEYVHDHGERRATVPRKRIAELQRKLDELRFFERDPLGNLHGPVDCIRSKTGTSCTFTDVTICSHTSTAVLTVRTGRRTHTVRNDHCEPSPLEELEELIDDIARTSAWIGGRVDSPIDVRVE